MPPTRARPATARADLAAALGVDGGAGVLVPATDVARGLINPTLLRTPVVMTEGVVMRLVVLGRRTSAVLHGPGQLLPAVDDGGGPFTEQGRALEPSRLVRIDAAVQAAIGAQPELAAAVAHRAQAQLDGLSLQFVVAQLTSIEERLGLLLPTLAESFGAVTADGVALPAWLSHTVLAALVGVRRPSLTTALTALADDGRLVRLPDRRWLAASSFAGLGA